MLLKDYISESVSALSALYPPEEARAIVMMVCGELLGVKSYTHIVEPQTEVPASRMQALEEAKSRLMSSEPVQYVLGHAVFHDLDFHVTPAVLIPRPETEEITLAAIRTAGRIRRMREAYGKSASPVRVLDLCTGSGCISWTIALNVPGCEVVAVDISEDALEVARHQDFSRQLAERHAVAPQFVRADVLNTAEIPSWDAFDLIISNPPYVMDSQKVSMRRNVLEHEPPLALFVPDDDPLVFYRAVAAWACRLLAPGGQGIVEINDMLGRETEAVFRRAGFTHASLVKDYTDKDRSVIFSR